VSSLGDLVDDSPLELLRLEVDESFGHFAHLLQLLPLTPLQHSRRSLSQFAQSKRALLQIRVLDCRVDFFLQSFNLADQLSSVSFGKLHLNIINYLRQDLYASIQHFAYLDES
jgi:hypothetical protein